VLIDRKVTFVLINRFGDRCNLGFRIFAGQTDRITLFDADGDTFADLETAVRAHAAELTAPPAPSRLVLTHKPAVAAEIDGEDRGKSAGRGHPSGTPASRVPPSRNSPCGPPLRKRGIEKRGSSAMLALGERR
jgi:hypothetical protein